MSSKNTWLWVTTALALFAFIFLFNRYRPRPDIGPHLLLPDLNPKLIKTIQIRPAGQLEIRVERTNGAWRLVEPVTYAAQGSNVQALLDALQKLTVAHRISEREFRKDPKAEESFGIDPPQISLVLNSGGPIFFGHRTSPGDQVFVRVPGIEGIAIVDAGVLNLFPPNANAWRDTTLADFKGAAFDRITVSNTVKSQSFTLQRDATNKLWAMTFPLKTRADSAKVDSALQVLEKFRIQRFVSDDPKADLESYGLQPAAVSISLGRGTNIAMVLDFGKELTNSSGLVFARRRDQNAVVAVSTNALREWSASYDVFRDRHLLSLFGAIESITVHGVDNFSLHWQTNSAWRVMPQNFPADEILSTRLARTLSEMQVANFEKDSVTESDWANYGLAAPARKYVIAWTPSPTATNPPTELDFGTTTNGQVFARRLGEEAVYGITPADFEALPAASWEMRDRHIWNFDVNDVTRIDIEDGGKTRQIVHNGTNGWSLATNSSGTINGSAIEDTVRELGHLTAFSWVGHGAAKLPQYGFAQVDYHLSIELKSGEKLNLQIGAATRLDTVFASVVLDGEPWVFEFPPDLLPSVRFCLTISP